MISYIRLMRPKHYLKNFLVLIPLFFSKIKDIKEWILSLGIKEEDYISIDENEFKEEIK